MRQNCPNLLRHVQQMGNVNTMPVLRIITKVRTTAVLSFHFILKPAYANLSLEGMLPCDYSPLSVKWEDIHKAGNEV
jgi:hypothetical protein